MANATAWTLIKSTAADKASHHGASAVITNTAVRVAASNRNTTQTRWIHASMESGPHCAHARARPAQMTYAVCMASPTHQIRMNLEHVAALRAVRAGDLALAQRVAAIKRYQHDRFMRDYADLLDSERFGEATRFFLNDLYGPDDFADRDAQFGRVVPAMAQLLPTEVMHTVAQLAELHALSESLDQEMARQLDAGTVDDRSYRAAWRAVGRDSDRERQLELLIAIGTSLDQQTRTPLLLTTLRLMRGPARAAGFAQLQSFLERGLAAFVSMGGAQEFLGTVIANESRVIDELRAPPLKEKTRSS